MKKAVLLFVISSCMFTLFGQPAIDFQGVPTGGYNLTRYNFPQILTPFDEGEMLTWDFSDLTVSDSSSTMYTIVDHSPYDADFPDATYIVYDGDNYSYSILDSDEYTLLGIKGPKTNNIFIDPLNYYMFPFAYGTTNSDDYQAPGQPVVNSSRAYVGYGTLITPAGSFDNVALLHIIEEVSGSQIDEYYEFLSMATLRALLVYFVMPSPPVGTREYMKDVVASTAVQEVYLQNFKVLVSPDPVTDRALITFNLPGAMHVHAGLLSMDGREVMMLKDADLPQGDQEILIEKGNLAAGTYLLRLVIGSTPVVCRIAVL